MTTDVKGTGAYADINGLHQYYETHGQGRPMILLHGGLGSGEMFGPTLPALAETHQVIAPDLQGHGRTADIDRPIDPRLMADDIAALIDHLGLEKPDLVGYSLGGGVAFFTASKYPEKVGKLVMAAAHVRRDAIPAEMLAQQGQVNAAAAEFMKDTPMYELYMRRRAAPGGLPAAARQDGRIDGEGLRPQRGGPRPQGADADRVPPMPTWRHRATTSRCSSCSTAASATAAGWARAGRREVTRSRSCPASRTTTSPSRRCSPRSFSTSSTASRPGLDMRDLGSRDDIY